jgi:hypothetical protein
LPRKVVSKPEHVHYIHLVTPVEQLGNKYAADVSGATGDENFHGFLRV